MTSTYHQYRRLSLSMSLVLSFLSCSLPGVLFGQNAAPSSHLVFDDNFEGDILINEVRVPPGGEALYTYYETLGWRGEAGGYAGIQAHPRAHNYIFSIWDHKSHTAPIKAVHHGPGTMTEKFGGEGTGLKSWNFTLGWETNTWYTLVSRCWPVGDHTLYGFWVRSGTTRQWTHLITMDVAAKEAFFQGGTDSFIEDWLDTGVQARTTHIRNGWKRKLDGEWHAFGSGRYSVNQWDLAPGKRSFNYRTNWNGGTGKDATGEFYFMTAGGRDTKATAANPSKHTIQRTDQHPKYPPLRIQTGRLRAGAGDSLIVSWENHPETLPQFSYSITAYDNPSGKGEPLARLEKVEPHARTAKLALPESVKSKQIFLRLQTRDILDNDSPVLSLRFKRTLGSP